MSHGKNLSLFHGPLGRKDGFDLFMNLFGEEVTCFDLEIDESHDWCDDVLFNPIVEDICPGTPGRR